MFSFIATHSARRLRRLSAARRQTVVAQGHGQTMLFDCQRHREWWSGVVKVRDGNNVRVVHVCSQLRPSIDAALSDAEQDAQRLALMFAQ